LPAVDAAGVPGSGSCPGRSHLSSAELR